MKIANCKSEIQSLAIFNLHFTIFNFQWFALLLALSSYLFALSACQRQPPPANANLESPDTSTYRPLATPATEFEQKLQMVRDGGFRYVWVFTRHDGKAFTADDSAALHANAPKVVDWIGMEDRKKFIAGANSPIPPDNLPELKKQYKIEDMSKN